MRVQLLALVLCAVAVRSEAASFDCAAARSAPEKLICGNAELSALDETLAKAFTDAAAVAPRPMALRQDERDWIVQYRDAATDVQAMAQAYRNRIGELQAMAKDARAVPAAIDAATLRQACVALRHEQDEICEVEEAGAVGRGMSYQVQNYRAGDLRTAGGIVVLDAAGADLLHPVLWDAAESAHFAAPAIVASPQGALLEFPGSIEGTGDFNAGSLYQEVDGRWREVDTLGWQKALGARLPKGREVWKGVYPDWKTMTVETPLWRHDDGNCCPTGGSAQITLALRGDAIVLTGVRVSDKPLQ